MLPAPNTDLLARSVNDLSIYMLDPEGLVTSWNAGARDLMEYEAEEIIGEHFSRLYTSEERERDVPKISLETAAHEERLEVQGWRVRKDGACFWADVVIDPIRAADGFLLGFAKVTRDSPTRRKAELELRASEERFRLLVQSVTDYAIYMLDLDGRVSSWNAGAERFKRINLLITDVGLPGGMNGRQVADAARVSRPNLKVLFITGRS